MIFRSNPTRLSSTKASGDFWHTPRRPRSHGNQPSGSTDPCYLEQTSGMGHGTKRIGTAHGPLPGREPEFRGTLKAAADGLPQTRLLGTHGLPERGWFECQKTSWANQRPFEAVCTRSGIPGLNIRYATRSLFHFRIPRLSTNRNSVPCATTTSYATPGPDEPPMLSEMERSENPTKMGTRISAATASRMRVRAAE